MSQEDVEIVRHFLEHALADPDSAWDIYADDVVWDLTGASTAPDVPQVSHGPDGVREFFRRWMGAFDGWGFEVEEYIDGPDAVVACIRQWGRGKGSGVHVDHRFWQVWSLRRGKAVRVTHQSDRESALEAAGL